MELKSPETPHPREPQHMPRPPTQKCRNLDTSSPNLTQPVEDSKNGFKNFEIINDRKMHQLNIMIMHNHYCHYLFNLIYLTIFNSI